MCRQPYTNTEKHIIHATVLSAVSLSRYMSICYPRAAAAAADVSAPVQSHSSHYPMTPRSPANAVIQCINQMRTLIAIITSYFYS